MVTDTFIEEAPEKLLNPYQVVITEDAVRFVAELATEFGNRIQELYSNRKKTSSNLSANHNEVLSFTSDFENKNWTVDLPPYKLQRRNVDLGDVSPTNLDHFISALNSEADGIQVDLDDGHCPTWRNQILAHYHVFKAVRNELPNACPIEEAPALLFRPRAWNMTEYHMAVNGLFVPGPIFDFGLHMFHNGRLLFVKNVGPYFYLPKLESASEARLWDDLFVRSQEKLGIKIGTIKACVLIENIVAATQMEGILFALRRHSFGLNCGIWDYCASIIAKFGRQPSFLLPDRNKYVNVDKHFLKKYMELTVSICRKRGTFATSGMATLLTKIEDAPAKVAQAKRKEIQLGFDGFMVYDVKLVPHMRRLWEEFSSGRVSPHVGKITTNDLLTMPPGGVTMEGLRHNVKVSVFFVAHWLVGMGHFELDGAVEDSATAEISRWQIWQWLRHEVGIENSNLKVNFQLIQNCCRDLSKDFNDLRLAIAIFYELVTLIDPPEFITTYLSSSHLFRNYSVNVTSRL